MFQSLVNNMSLAEKAKIQIQKYIKTLDLEESNKLPREEILAEIIGVSRITIRSALNELAGEGIVFRRQGKGTFVNVNALNIKVKFSPVMNFSEMIKNSGYKPSVKLIDISMVENKQIKKMLNISNKDMLIKCRKIFLADDKFCAYTIDFLPLSTVGSEDNFATLKAYPKSIYEFIHMQSEKQIVWDRVEIDTANVSEVPEQYIDSSISKPLLLLKGLNYDLEDEPIIYTKEYINTDIIKFNMIRQRSIKY